MKSWNIVGVGIETQNTSQFMAHKSFLSLSEVKNLKNISARNVCALLRGEKRKMSYRNSSLFYLFTKDGSLYAVGAWNRSQWHAVALLVRFLYFYAGYPEV
jgi:hypothetical protein